MPVSFFFRKFIITFETILSHFRLVLSHMHARARELFYIRLVMGKNFHFSSLLLFVACRRTKKRERATGKELLCTRLKENIET